MAPRALVKGASALAAVLPGLVGVVGVVVQGRGGGDKQDSNERGEKMPSSPWLPRGGHEVHLTARGEEISIASTTARRRVE